MRLIRSLFNLTREQQGGVWTIGNFDGVHIGHQQLLAKVREKARELNVPAGVISFEPMPFEFFAKDQVTIPRLTRLREKFYAIAACGIDYLLILPFNQQLAQQTAKDFSATLAKFLQPKHIYIGDDFHFGYKREGNITLLQAQGKVFDFSTEAIAAVKVGGERISSTRIRQALANADHALAKQLLGRPYTMMGRVRHGDKLGKQLGFPTINIHLHRKLTPIHGIYTVYVYGVNDQDPQHPYPGAANIGTRPSVDGTNCLLEVHLLDFNQDIYGRYVTVEFCEKLHEEIHYPNLTILKEQIAKDIAAARQYFQRKGGL